MSTILVAVGLVVSVSLISAVFLLIAERRLVNFGICSLDINDGERVLEVEGGDSLLSSLRSKNLFIPSACGGKGTCAYCKVKILEGGGPVAPTEEPLLEPSELQNSIRISCQCKVRNDMKIEIPQELLSVKEYKGRVKALTDLTHDIKLLRIELIEPSTIKFTPGQYVQLKAPPYGDSTESVYRAYSLASSPNEEKSIELIIRKVPQGICTTYVFDHLNEGDEVFFNGPYGEFKLSDEKDREMIWIAGGSGMAPFWSMIRYMDEEGLARKCTYFFGAHEKKDIFFLEELMALEKKHEWFKFVPALSSPEKQPDWEGESGLITEVVGKHMGEGKEKEGYLCGSPGMIDASVKVLGENGVADERVYFDKFA